MRHFIRLLSGHLKNMAEFEHLKEPDCQIHTISLFYKKAIKLLT